MLRPARPPASQPDTRDTAPLESEAVQPVIDFIGLYEPQHIGPSWILFGLSQRDDRTGDQVKPIGENPRPLRPKIE